MEVRKFKQKMKSFTMFDVIHDDSPYIHLLRGLSFADAAVLFIDATQIFG